MHNKEVVPTDGKYYPLAFSTSYPLTPNGMDPQEERTLVELGQIFGFPRAPAELSASLKADNWSWPTMPYKD